MKRLFFSLAVCLFSSLNIFAQKGEMTIGGQLLYGSEIENLGIGARFQYGITDQLRLAPSINFYLPKNDLNWLEVNADVHYLFPMEDKFKLYPLAGLSLVRVSYDYDNEYAGDLSGSNTEFGINLGGGAQYELTEQLYLNGELKYNFNDDWDQFVISVGVAFKF